MVYSRWEHVGVVLGGDGHGFVREYLIRSAEGLVGGNGDAAVFIAPGDPLEEDAGLGLVLVGKAISCQSLWKLGRRSAVNMLGSVWMRVSRAIMR